MAEYTHKGELRQEPWVGSAEEWVLEEWAYMTSIELAEKPAEMPERTVLAKGQLADIQQKIKEYETALRELREAEAEIVLEVHELARAV